MRSTRDGGADHRAAHDSSILGLPLDQATIDAREEIGVTNAQIVTAVQKWLRPNDFVRVILGPAP